MPCIYGMPIAYIHQSIQLQPLIRSQVMGIRYTAKGEFFEDLLGLLNLSEQSKQSTLKEAICLIKQAQINKNGP